MADGSVVTMGIGTQEEFRRPSAAITAQDVETIFSTVRCLRGLATNGSSGDLGNLKVEIPARCPSLTSGVATIFSTSSAYAALKTDGSVVWEFATGGGVRSSAAITSESRFSNDTSFAIFGRMVPYGDLKQSAESSPPPYGTYLSNDFQQFMRVIGLMVPWSAMG